MGRLKQEEINYYGYDVVAAVNSGWVLNAPGQVYVPGFLSANRVDATDVLVRLAKAGDENAILGLAEALRRRMGYGPRNRRQDNRRAE